MAERLKECPFCTATAAPNGPVDIYIANDITEVWVECGCCDCCGPAVSFDPSPIGVTTRGMLASCKLDAIELAVSRWNDAPRPVESSAAVTPNAMKMLAQMALTGDPNIAPAAAIHDEFDLMERAGRHDEG